MLADHSESRPAPLQGNPASGRILERGEHIISVSAVPPACRSSGKSTKARRAGY